MLGGLPEGGRFTSKRGGAGVPAFFPVHHQTSVSLRACMGGQKWRNGPPMMLMMLAPLASIIASLGPGFSLCQASRLPVPTAPGLMLDVATMEAIMSPREFHGGFAMGMLMDGVMGCRTYGGFMQVFCCFFTVF